jgi:hypothetical protein
MGSTATGNGLYNTLESLAIEAKTWECKLLFNEAVDRDAPPEIVDLCDFLSPITKRKRTSNLDYPNRTNYMFPERFKGLASKTQLEMELRLAAIKGGFTLELRTSQTADAIVKNCPKGGSDRAYSFKLHCSRATIYTPTRVNTASQTLSSGVPSVSSTVPVSYKQTRTTRHVAKSVKTKVKNKTVVKKVTQHRPVSYKTTTKKATVVQDKCDFNIGVFLQSDTAKHHPGRWFLSQWSSTAAACGCRHHKQHLQIDPSLLHVSLKCMTQEEL